MKTILILHLMKNNFLKEYKNQLNEYRESLENNYKELEALKVSNLELKNELNQKNEQLSSKENQ